MDDCVSFNEVPNVIYYCQNAQRVSLYPRSRTQSQHFSPSHFGVSNSQTTELQGAHLPFFVDLVSFMRKIEYNEFDSNYRTSNLSNLIMMHRDLDATDRILRDFISGHLMHLHLISGVRP
jgi:hypothetical protein